MPNWTILNLDAQLGSRKRNDTILADDAARRAIPMITRDGVVAKSKARGGAAITPEAYAATALTFDNARRAFFQRFDAHAPSWVLEAADGDVNSEFTRRQCHWLKFWRIRCEYIWSDEPERYFLDTSIGELVL